MVRTSTLNSMDVDPGNIIVDMETHDVYFDIFDINDTVARITLTNGYSRADADETFISESDILTLIDQLNQAAVDGV